jgi:hypothetical protein
LAKSVLAVTAFDPDGPGPLPKLLIACGNFTPILNIADFTCYLQKFAAGCP